MKHLKLFFALFAMLALGVTNAWGAEQTVKWTATSGALGNGIGSGTIKTGTYAWNYTRTLISGASYTGWSSSCIQLGKNGGVENITFTTSAIPGTIKSVAVECSSYNNAHKVSIAVGGTTYLAATATAKWTTVGTQTGTGSSTGTINISFTGGTRALYIKSITVVYEETSSGGTEPVLSSIEISGDLTKKTYEEGDELDLAGLTVNATYDDASTKVVTNDVEWSYTPNPLTEGTTSVDITASYEEKTVTKTITGLTVNEHIITPSEYCIVPNNAFWGTSYNGSDANAATTLSGTQNDISILHTKSGSNLYVNDTQTRVYTNHAMQISVPSGYVIISIAFTADGNNWAGTHTANVGKMTDSKNWAGFANEVTITFGGTCRITKICVNYIKDVKYALTITEPAAGTGTLVVKDGENALTSGAEIYEGTKLTVISTPENGYEEGVVVVKNASDEDVTATIYADGVLTMPAYAVTISATFEKKPCELLAKPTVSAETTYSSAKLTWEAVANAAKYSVKVGTADAVETTETSYDITGLTAETTYTYQVQAIAEAGQDTYCDSEVAEGTFITATAPIATLTLSDIDGTTTQTGALNGTITLPTEAAECSKTFVGWDADENCDQAPTYAPGAEYTFTTLDPTLYAVYADENNAAKEEVYTFTEFTQANTVTIDAPESFTITLLKGTASTAPQWNSGSSQARVYAKGSLVISADAPISKIVYTYIVNKNNNGVEPTIDGVSGNNNAGNWDASAKTWTGNDTKVTFSTSGTAGNVGFTKVAVTIGAITYSNYSTTCVAAPKAEVNPTSVTANAAGVEGKVTVTYDNVKTENVAVALFNDAACTDAFTADWLTVSLDGDKNITYTISATTLYTERKAYIKLTAPETTGAIDPAVVVIPVTQAGKDKVFASLEELLANITPTEAATKVTVTLTKEPIVEIYVSGTYRNGIYLNVPYQGENKKIEIYCWNVPATWVLGGSVSGTLTNCDWKDYNGTWELCPADWSELTYTAPATVSSIAVSGTPTTTTYVDGEKFDPAGLVVTATYSDATTEVVTTYANWTIDPATLTKGQTSVNVTATYNSISSAAHEVTGLTVNDIPTKTVAEFIAARGTRCYLEGVVSGLTEGNSMKYGNFDLTDASGTIYVYGCLNASGEKEKFAELDVKNGDKIKVIADELTVYNSKDQAKNVQYVSHISAATITIANISMEVNEVKTISATLDPAEAEVTYTIKENTSNAISLSGNTITALAEGIATITASVVEGADYLGNSVDFTVTVTPQNIATLPFTFDGGVGEIATTLGMSQDGLDSDYGSSPKLKFDDKDDYVIIHFDERPGKLTYDIKANTGSGAFSGEFAVQESADGVTYRDLVKYSTISGSKETKTHNCFDKDTRYIKFVFVAKDNGNVALGNIKIETSVVTKATPSVEKGIFSVGNGEFVQFSTGNLQYEVGTNTWSFASEQYEVIGGEAYTGSNNTNYGMNVPGYTGKLDLFAWSCDDKYGVNPSNADADYTGGFADWGDLVSEAGWSTLTRAQMEYLLERKKDGKKLWGLATLEGKVALILLPDNWNTAIEFTYGYVPTKWNFTANELTKEDWNNLEANGAVLLPAGGSRAGGYGNKIGFDGETVETDATKLDANGDYFHVDNVGDYGYYWLSSTAGELADYLILPASDNTGANTYSPDVWSREKRRGNSVRLVKAVEPDYTREVRPGYYGTICLPTAGQMVGASIFEIAYKDASKIYFDEIVSGEMEAGIPYIFLPNEGVTTLKVFYTEMAVVAAGSRNGLVGYYDNTDNMFNVPVGNYILLNNQYCEVVGTNAYIMQNYSYIVLKDVPGSAPAQAPGRRRVAIGQAPQVATGIENIDASAQPVKTIINGQLFILRGEKMYDAQGKLVK